MPGPIPPPSPGSGGGGVKFPEWGVTRDFQVHEVTNWLERRLVETLSFPYAVVWFESKAAAETFAHKGQGNLPGPTGPPGSPLSGIQNVGDFFHRLTEQSTWIRVGEVIGGGILLFIGVRALAHGSSTVGAGARKTVTKPVRRVAKTAITVAAPEARYAGRVAAKRVAPKTTAKVSAHRAKVAKYGQKKPYRPPEPRPARQPTVRVSHIYHHAQNKPTKARTVKSP